jgi:Tfp pilus assembly protein PilX
MRGNILITVLILLTVLSLSGLYGAREGLWAMKMSQVERDSLQLDVFIDEALLRVEQLVENFPTDIAVLPAQEANVFLEQSLQTWLTDKQAVKLSLSEPTVQAWAIFEHLNTHDTQEYFRTTLLLLTQTQQSQLRMQATWKRTTLKNDIIQVDSLAWR